MTSDCWPVSCPYSHKTEGTSCQLSAGATPSSQMPPTLPATWPHHCQFSNRDSLSCGIPLSPWNYLESLLDSQLTRTHPPKKTSFLKSTMPLNITTFQKWHQGHSFQAGVLGHLEFLPAVPNTCLLPAFVISMHFFLRLEADIMSQGKLTSREDALKLEQREHTWDRPPTHH